VGGNGELRDAPDILAALRYAVKLTGPDGVTNEYTLTGGEHLELAAATGQWRIDAEAFLPEDDEHVVGRGRRKRGKTAKERKGEEGGGGRGRRELDEKTTEGTEFTEKFRIPSHLRVLRVLGG
jgi:hypothetical protein